MQSWEAHENQAWDLICSALSQSRQQTAVCLFNEPDYYFISFKPRTLLFIKQSPIFPLFNFPFDARPSYSWPFPFLEWPFITFITLLREDILSLQTFRRPSSSTFFNQIHIISVMYQLFTGKPDSLWIYLADSLVYDWQRERCENHLPNLIHGTFNTAFDNKQWFLTLNRGRMPKPRNARWALCSGPLSVSGIVRIWWTSLLQSHWRVTLITGPAGCSPEGVWEFTETFSADSHGWYQGAALLAVSS